MAHFYDCTTTNEPKFEKNVTTPAQARKNNTKTYPSVTTVLGIIKDDFLDMLVIKVLIDDASLWFVEGECEEVSKLKSSLLH